MECSLLQKQNQCKLRQKSVKSMVEEMKKKNCTHAQNEQQTHFHRKIPTHKLHNFAFTEFYSLALAIEYNLHRRSTVKKQRKNDGRDENVWTNCIAPPNSAVAVKINFAHTPHRELLLCREFCIWLYRNKAKCMCHVRCKRSGRYNVAVRNSGALSTFCCTRYSSKRRLCEGKQHRKFVNTDRERGRWQKEVKEGRKRVIRTK